MKVHNSIIRKYKNTKIYGHMKIHVFKSYESNKNKKLNNNLKSKTKYLSIY